MYKHQFLDQKYNNVHYKIIIRKMAIKVSFLQFGFSAR